MKHSGNILLARTRAIQARFDRKMHEITKKFKAAGADDTPETVAELKKQYSAALQELYDDMGEVHKMAHKQNVCSCTDLEEEGDTP